MLRQTDLLKALSDRNARSRVASKTSRDVVTIDITEMMDAGVANLNACECHALPVTQDGEIVGLVTSENLGALVPFGLPQLNSNERKRSWS